MKCSDFRILIAEDDPGAQLLYRKVFKQEGYDVEVVDSGEKVLYELDNERYHLLITDLKLDGMSALEFLPKVRMNHTRLPIIVVSGYYRHLKEDFHQKGFFVDMFFNKPLKMGDLKAAVRTLLGLPTEEEMRQTLQAVIAVQKA